MLAVVVLAVVAAVLVVAWRHFDLASSSHSRVVLAAFGGGVAATTGLFLSWALQPPTDPARWLVMLSDALVLFPLVAIVGSDTRLLTFLGPVLTAVELSAVLLLVMAVARWATRRRLEHGGPQ